MRRSRHPATGPQVGATASWSRARRRAPWRLRRRNAWRGDGERGRCARDARLFREHRRRDVSRLPCDGAPRVRDAPPLSDDVLLPSWTSWSPFSRRVYNCRTAKQRTRLRAASAVSYCTPVQSGEDEKHWSVRRIITSPACVGMDLRCGIFEAIALYPFKLEIHVEPQSRDDHRSTVSVVADRKSVV